jgi:hypothetical protein
MLTNKIKRTPPLELLISSLKKQNITESEDYPLELY